MRLSTREQDPGFSPTANDATVSVDGIEMVGFTTADDEAGFVRVGTEIHRGKVEIVLAPLAAPEPPEAIPAARHKRDRTR
jgi:hypothetical protein